MRLLGAGLCLLLVCAVVWSLPIAQEATPVGIIAAGVLVAVGLVQELKRVMW